VEGGCHERYAACPSLASGVAAALRRFDPDVSVVHRSIEGRFADPTRATSYISGAAGFGERHLYYRRLREGTSGYSLIRDFGDVEVYGRIPVNRGESAREGRWADAR
jgi:hypothetical protein